MFNKIHHCYYRRCSREANKKSCGSTSRVNKINAKTLILGIFLQQGRRFERQCYFNAVNIEANDGAVLFLIHYSVSSARYLVKPSWPLYGPSSDGKHSYSMTQMFYQFARSFAHGRKLISSVRLAQQ